VHWFRQVSEVAVEAFPQSGAAVAAIETQLIDEDMCQRVEKQELCSNVAIGLLTSGSCRIVVRGKGCDTLLNAGLNGKPVVDLCRIQFEKDALAINLCSREPIDVGGQFEWLQTRASMLDVGCSMFDVRCLSPLDTGCHQLSLVDTQSSGTRRNRSDPG
jgi:hypothetical protein